MRGDELIDKHYQSLAEGLVSRLPSVSVAWEKLSHWLHTRTGEAEDYEPQRDAICKQG
jgi:hypothetical protein